MHRQAYVYKWMCFGALIGLIFAVVTTNDELLGSLRAYGIPDFGYFFSIAGGTLIGGSAAFIYNWFQRER